MGKELFKNIPSKVGDLVKDVPDISTYRSVLCPEGDDATWMIDRAG